MDLTHLGYVHGSTIGGNPMTHVEAKMDTVRTPLGLKFSRWMLNSVPPPTYVRAVGFPGAHRPGTAVRVHRPRRDPATQRRRRGGRLSGRRYLGEQPEVPAVPRADPGDRNQLPLFLVHREWLPPQRSGGHRAVVRRNRRCLQRRPHSGGGPAGPPDRARGGRAGGHRHRLRPAAHAPHARSPAGGGSSGVGCGVAPFSPPAGRSIQAVSPPMEPERPCPPSPRTACKPSRT